MGLPALQPRQIALVKQTIAKDCNAEEFDLFMQAAKSYGLDPFTKQIIPLVFNKGNERKRQMTIVVTRDGLRVMASRCGDYRPASEPAQYVTDESLKSQTNPHGIVSARVTLWKQDRVSGEWFPVAGEAYWDEFAPTKFKWENGQRTNEPELEGNWRKMPRVMITKCAEAQALRAGWPEQFCGVYVQEEMDRATFDEHSASEIVEQAQTEQRLKLVNAQNSIMIVWLSGMQMEPVSLGSMADRCLEWVNDPSRTLEQLEDFSNANQHSLREFWAKAPSDALEVKRAIEDRFKQLGDKAA